MKTIHSEYDKGFWIVFKQIQKMNFKSKTLDIVKKAKDYNKEEIEIFKADYSNSIAQIIGSMLSTLIYKAKHTPEEYITNRLSYLKDIADMVKNEIAYKELYELVEYVHYLSIEAMSTHFQLMMELDEIIDMLTPFNNELVGLDGNKPIFIPSKFPFTKYYIGKAMNMADDSQKNRDMLILEQNYARSNLKHFHSLTYGLYNNDNYDMLPINSVNLLWFNKSMRLPRRMGNTDKLIELIQYKTKFVINKNGVVIDCYNAGDIETIFLQISKQYLLFKVVFNEKGWALDKNGNLVQDVNNGEYTGFIHLKSFKKGSDFYYDYSYLCEISESMDIVYSIHEFIIECYADLVCGADVVKNFSKITSSDSILFDNEVDDDTLEEYFNDKNKIGVRFTPKNLYNQGKRKTSRTSYTTRERYFVSGHLRKLPYGCNASIEATENASEFGIYIPNGYTFVSPYYSGIEKVRSYYKKVVE